MDEKIIAIKSNFPLLTKFLTIFILIVFIVIPSENKLFIFLNYVAFAGILVAIILIILHLMQPKELINYENDKIYINKINKTIAIEIKAISNIVMKNKNSRGVKYQYGTIIIYTKNNKMFKINNIDKVEEVKRKLDILKN